MKWPGDLSIGKRNVRDSLFGVTFGWIGGFSADQRIGEDVNEREMRRIRARQINAVTRLVPITMTVNLVNVALVVGVFWDIAPKIFLSGWALAIASAAVLAIRSWLRTRRRAPSEASSNATKRMTIQSFILALLWGMLPVVLLPTVGADASD